MKRPIEKSFGLNKKASGRVDISKTIVQGTLANNLFKNM